MFSVICWIMGPAAGGRRGADPSSGAPVGACRVDDGARGLGLPEGDPGSHGLSGPGAVVKADDLRLVEPKCLAVEHRVARGVEACQQRAVVLGGPERKDVSLLDASPVEHQRVGGDDLEPVPPAVFGFPAVPAVGEIAADAGDDRVLEEVAPVDRLEQGVSDRVEIPVLVADHLGQVVAVPDLPPHGVAGEDKRVAAGIHEGVEVLPGAPRPVFAVTDEHQDLGGADLPVVLQVGVRNVASPVAGLLGEPRNEVVAELAERLGQGAEDGDGVGPRSRVEAPASGVVVGVLRVRGVDDQYVGGAIGVFHDEWNPAFPDIEAAGEVRHLEGESGSVAEPLLPRRVGLRLLRRNLGGDRVHFATVGIVQAERLLAGLLGVDVQGGGVPRSVGRPVNVALDDHRDDRVPARRDPSPSRRSSAATSRQQDTDKGQASKLAERSPKPHALFPPLPERPRRRLCSTLFDSPQTAPGTTLSPTSSPGGQRSRAVRLTLQQRQSSELIVLCSARVS